MRIPRPCSSESFSEIQPEPNTLNRFSAQTHRCESGVVILLREISGAEIEWAPVPRWWSMKTIIEPFRIKSVEPLHRTTPAERERLLLQAAFNLFELRASDILIDLLT